MAISPLSGEAKVIRLRENSHEVRRKQRLKALAEFRRQLALGGRKTFVFLLGATLFVFLFSHQKEIQRATDLRVNHVVAKIEKSSQSSRLRQSALNYEHEVDAVTQ